MGEIVRLPSSRQMCLLNKPEINTMQSSLDSVSDQGLSTEVLPRGDKTLDMGRCEVLSWSRRWRGEEEAGVSAPSWPGSDVLQVPQWHQCPRQTQTKPQHLACTVVQAGQYAAGGSAHHPVIYVKGARGSWQGTT